MFGCLLHNKVRPKNRTNISLLDLELKLCLLIGSSGKCFLINNSHNSFPFSFTPANVNPAIAQNKH